MGQLVQNLNKPTTVYDHIRELQMRFVICALTLVAAGVIVYFFYGSILTILTMPLKSPLYYSTPAGSFTFVMRICFTGALIITIPVIVYNLIMFVQPAFDKVLSTRRVLVTTLFSTILAISGAVFAYYVILPGTLSFFKGFQVSGLNALISADNYLGFVTNIIAMFAVVFQIPLLLHFIDKIKPLEPKNLLKYEKWVILGSLVVALLAPFTYDLVTSLLIALPIIVLYNLSIVMVMTSHAQLERKARNTVNAIIAQPQQMTQTEITLNELIYEGLADELVNLDKPAPVINLVSNYDTAMDIKRPAVKQQVAVPAWVEERKAKRATLINQQIHVFSDFRPVNRANHALA